MTLYQGGEYHLYRYKKYTDVRLVFAPEFSIAFFGGDPDNFEYPRYDLDMTLVRVYENGVPAKIDHYLKWSAEGAKENELIFVSGHPGRTSRLLTTAAISFLKDVQVPYLLTLLQRRENVLQQYANRGSEQARRAKSELFSVQNSRKVYLGRRQGLLNKKLMAQKQRREYELRSKVAEKPELEAVQGAWGTIARAQQEARRLYERRAYLETGHAFNSRLSGFARALVRMAEEDRKPNADRLPEYRDSARASLEQSLFSKAPIYADLEIAKLADSLAMLVERFGEHEPLVQQVMEGKGPEARAVELVEGTQLFDPAVRRVIAKGGWDEIQVQPGSDDPLG